MDTEKRSRKRLPLSLSCFFPPQYCCTGKGTTRYTHLWFSCNLHRLFDLLTKNSEIRYYTLRAVENIRFLRVPETWCIPLLHAPRSRKTHNLATDCLFYWSHEQLLLHRLQTKPSQTNKQRSQCHAVSRMKIVGWVKSQSPSEKLQKPQSPRVSCDGFKAQGEEVETVCTAAPTLRVVKPVQNR